MADNRIAYGLCEELGIDTNGMAPYECWKALKEHGITPNNCEQKLRDLKRDKAERIYGTSNESKLPKPPTEVYEFERLHSDHHERHVYELGFKNPPDYEKGARKFWGENVGKLYYGNRRGRFYKYDIKTERLLVVGSDGAIYTFMKLDKKQFTNYVKGEQLNEIIK